MATAIVYIVIACLVMGAIAAAVSLAGFAVIVIQRLFGGGS